MTEDQYPSLDLAYPVAVDSYDLSRERLGSVEIKIQKLMTVSVGLTAAIPVALKAMDFSIGLSWLVSMLVIFGLSSVIGICGLLVGRLSIMDPGVLHDEYIPLEPWKFKKAYVYWSGKHLVKNDKMIERKWKAAVAMSFLLFLEFLVVVGAVFFP